MITFAAAGVHDPQVQPFMVAWTDASPEERARGTLQYHWSRWGSWQPADWMLELAVLRDGHVVVPRGDTVLHQGDEVLVLVTGGVEDDVRRALVG